MKTKVKSARKARVRCARHDFHPMYQTPVWYRRLAFHHFGPDYREYDSNHGIIGAEAITPIPV